MNDSSNHRPKSLRFLTCKVMQREAYLCASRSRNIVDVDLMPQGLHNEPDRLRSEVQRELEITKNKMDRDYDAVLLGYGLCSNGIVGLTAKITTVIPRGHDCITIILGSKERYMQYFKSKRGIYWYTPGWIDTASQPGRERYKNALQKYRDKYGEDNAEYLMEMEQNWMKEYSTAAFINWDLPVSEENREFTKESASFLNWDFDELKGDQALMQRLVDGEWDDESFLVLQQGQTVTADPTSSRIIGAK